MNYVFYLSAMWYSTGLEILPKTGSRYEIYIERVGSGTTGLAIMAICGFFLCRMMREYYRGMIDRYVEANKNLELSRNLSNEIEALADIYLTVFELDLLNDSFTEVRSADRHITELVNNARSDVRITLSEMMEGFASDEYRDEVAEFTDFDTIDYRMRNKNVLSMEYKNREGLWRRGRLVAYRRAEDGRVLNVLGVVEDIDDEKCSRDRLIEISEKAVAASEAKSAFLSNVSHEIRTPINAVLGMNEIILRESEDTNALEYAQGIKQAGTTLLGLINDLLDFSKIEAGKMGIVPVDYDLSSVVNDLVNMLHIKADQKGLDVTLAFDRNIPKLLRGDELRIKQIVTNLLSNAVKYTEKGTVTFRIGFERVEGEKNLIRLRVSVEDTGVGIKHEDIDKLFVKFERVDEERYRNVEG
ncbi:MAG: hypothetical protein K5929_03320, partial [Lachnospiraceae bacterium]|nr:hypothetical protein [Lachnospiraceae bacterium]